MTDKSTVVGFDFGTTNSLISVVVGDRAIHIMDPVNGLPFPSVVRYEGERSVVGREAKELLDSAGLGIHGSTVRSPKVLLGEDSVHVGGLERNPVDIVRDVVKHVKTQALASPRASVLEGVARAVVTIPVRMNGVKRRALRNAFTLADIRIVQFVHEPLAALYGYFRSHPDMDSLIREYDRRNIVVVDWGGGTLDLTLCRLVNRGILQIRNAGTDEVGGDKFDEAIRNGVIKRFMEAHAIPGDMEVYPDARIRLLHDSEMHKIALSTRSSVTFYRQGFFKAEDDTLEYTLTRAELEEITRTLVRRGLNEIENLLSTAGIGPSQVGMCLVAGGMAGMPAIIGRIHELFGPQRVVVARGTGTLVAEGSAWIAHDGQPLRLSKAIELQLARGAYFPLLPANTAMPTERQVKSRQFHLYCADPRDGSAKFGFYTPSRPDPDVQGSDPRVPLGTLVVDVDATAQPFRERLELALSLDDDMILHARAWSAEKKREDTADFHDLEFGISLPGEISEYEGATHDRLPESHQPPGHESGDLVVRSNLALEKDKSLVPGELLHTYDPGYFDVRRRPPDIQVKEYLYYQPCAVCRRGSSDPECRCASLYGRTGEV